MDYGAATFFTDYSMGPVALGRALEERGFESLWAPEHSHIPLSRQSPFPAGGDLPKKYYDVMDPFVTLAAAAAATARLKVATGICLVVQRDPIQTAKEVATLDQISGGRFLFGIGAGWNAEEMQDHGTEFKSRFRLMQERVEAMKAIWQNEEGSYRGELVKFDPIWSYPKPAQKPHPPILFGGHGEVALKRVVAYCDGWLPISMMAGDLKKQIGELHRLAREKGRDPRSISISVFWTQPDRQAIDAYGEMGAERVIFALQSESREKVLPILDGYAKLVR